MSYEFYKWLHLLGIFCLLASLGAIWGLHYPNRSSETKERRPLALIHGFGMLFVLVSGFGMLARLNLGMQGWVYAKLLIWLAMGGTIALARRKAKLGIKLVAGWVLLGALAAYWGIFKPF